MNTPTQPRPAGQAEQLPATYRIFEAGGGNNYLLRTAKPDGQFAVALLVSDAEPQHVAEVLTRLNSHAALVAALENLCTAANDTLCKAPPATGLFSQAMHAQSRFIAQARAVLAEAKE